MNNREYNQLRKNNLRKDMVEIEEEEEEKPPQHSIVETGEFDAMGFRMRGQEELRERP